MCRNVKFRKLQWESELWELVLTFSAVLGPLFLLPFGRPLGRFGVGGPTGSCRVNITHETNQKQSSAPRRHGRTIRMHLPPAVSEADLCPCAEAQEPTGRSSALETALWSHCYSCLGLSTCVRELGIKSKKELPWELWGQRTRVSVAGHSRRKHVFFRVKTKSHFILKATGAMNTSRCLTRY